MKEGNYFPHYSTARNDIKLKRLMKDLGAEGYGLYFLTLEVLREQPSFKLPISDLSILAEDFKTTAAKLEVVISKYNLFQVDDETGEFFSPKLIENLEPFLLNKERRKMDGIKGNLIRYKHASKEELSIMQDHEVLALNEAIKNKIKPLKIENTRISSGGESGGDRNKIRREEIRRDKIRLDKSKKRAAYSFDDFLKDYGSLAGSSSKATAAQFKKLSPTDLLTLKENTPLYIEYLIIEDWRKKMGAAVFLNSQKQPFAANWREELQEAEKKNKSSSPSKSFSDWKSTEKNENKSNINIEKLF